MTAEVIDFGAPTVPLGRCPACQAPPRPLWERNGVRRCAACWAKAAAPRVVQFASAARPAGPCRFSIPYVVGSRRAGGYSANALYRPNGRGGKVLSDMGQRLRDEVALAVGHGRLVAPAGRLGMRVRFVPPDAKVRDPDNLLKGLQDATALAFGWEGDGRIAAVAVERMEPDPTNARIEVEISPLAAGGRHG